jgi:small subunit ribosomal protein S20
MANTIQARKRARQAIKSRARNFSQRLESHCHQERAKRLQPATRRPPRKSLSESMGTIDSIADKKIIHKNKAARHKSRLSAAIKAL